MKPSLNRYFQRCLWTCTSWKTISTRSVET